MRGPRCRLTTPADHGEGVSGVGRRALLSGVAVMGTGLAAGCQNWQGANGATTSPPDRGVWGTTIRGRVTDLDLAHLRGTLGTVVYDVGFLTHPETRDRMFVLAQSVDETSTRVTITFRDGLEWSTGDALGPVDIGRWLFMLRMGSSRYRRVPAIREGRRQPLSPIEAITDVEWDESTLSITGRFDAMASPLALVNSYLGSRPREYYRDLWTAFRGAYVDQPWEDDATWARVTELIDNNIWSLSDEYRPTGGFHLAGDVGGESDRAGNDAGEDGADDTNGGNTKGVEAAFSGLWYPNRIRENRLYFTPNETHPAADSVAHDELVWTFRPEPDARTRALRTGVVDGAMMTDLLPGTIEDVPATISAFEGPARDLDTLVVNASVSHLWNRDVRAALQYAIDREQLVADLNLITKSAVRVPGGDLQSDRWLPEELRDRLRSYSFDPDRAAELLSSSGFRRANGQWVTPDGEAVELQVLTPREYHPLELATVAQLRDFGVEASVLSVEKGTYRTRVDSRHFGATARTITSSNAAGLRRTRTADYVERIRRGDGFPISRFLEREVATAVRDRPNIDWHPSPDTAPIFDRRPAAADLDALTAITVPAPRFGEPTGDLREWPYLYHAAMATTGTNIDERIKHARRCTWIYNYQVPELELLIDTPHIFHDTTDWEIPPPDDPIWDYAQWTLNPGGLWAALALGEISPAP